MKLRIVASLTLLTAVVAVAFQMQKVRETSSLHSLVEYVPQGALLTIQSPDFASLLGGWSHSTESKAWIASDNNAVFANSRLFGRLSDAQTSFAAAAGVPAGVDLLKQVAGRESIFAWYDIGKLQFLYITRMDAEQANQTRLLQSRGTFERRHAGNSDFYIHTSSSDYSTVAFAEVPSPAGQVLLLATREDLIANALVLIAGGSPANSVAQEPWFQDASAALPSDASTPTLHMVLNLDRIAVDPHFRSYWVQQNITWTRQFRAAASDLYIEPARFREERVLLPRSSLALSDVNVEPLADLVPAPTGVFRAFATDSPAAAVSLICEKLLGRPIATVVSSEQAPNPSLDAPQAGDSLDLETRIDATPPAPTNASAEDLTKQFRTAGMDAMLSLSSADVPAQPDGLWVPIHSAVVVRTEQRMDAGSLAAALQQALRGSLTASTLGIEFDSSKVAGQEVWMLQGPRPFYFATSTTPARGNMVFFSDSQSLLGELLHNLATDPPKSSTNASTIAVFDHASQRVPYKRLMSIIDGTNHPQPSHPTVDAASAPAFFSRNISSLSDAFAALQSERVEERKDGANLHQTVTYNWQTP